MKRLILSILVIFLLGSCLSHYDRNLVRREVESGNIPHWDYAYYDHFLAVLLGIENTDIWKIFYEDDEFIYYGNLRNKTVIKNIYRIHKELLKRWIPLYNVNNIDGVLKNNIIKYLIDREDFNYRPLTSIIENNVIEYKYVAILGVRREGKENIRYQFEIFIDGINSLVWGRHRLNILIITDTKFNVLEAYRIQKYTDTPRKDSPY
jgi:hypothetical protein